MARKPDKPNNFTLRNNRKFYRELRLAGLSKLTARNLIAYSDKRYFNYYSKGLSKNAGTRRSGPIITEFTKSEDAVYLFQWLRSEGCKAELSFEIINHLISIDKKTILAFNRKIGPLPKTTEGIPFAKACAPAIINKYKLLITENTGYPSPSWQEHLEIIKTPASIIECIENNLY